MPRHTLSRFILSALLVAGASFASIVWAAQPSWKADEVIIKFKSNASQGDINAILADLHATKLKHFKRIKADHERITGISVEQAISRYRRHPAVEIIEPNYIYEASAVPNDPDFGQLWGLRNTGQVPGGIPGADINAVHAWDLTTGSSDIVVAIIDTGIDYNHPDLSANIYANPGEIPGNGIDDDANGFVDDVRGWDFVNFDNDPFDDHSHGTHCAGTIGASGNNGIGVVGVNWHVRLMPIKFLDSSGFGSTAGAIASIEYATLMGVDIMSNSWGGGGFSEALRQAIQDANDAGILFVAAAGNAGQNTDLSPNYPSGYDVPNVISVAATDPADLKAGFSNFGVVSVDLAAPGVQILSTTPGNTYSVFSGTSMATPHVAGALALVLAHFPGIPAPSAKAVILNSVDHLPSLSGLVLTGGRLNAARALEGADSIPPDPILDLAALGTGSNSIALDWTATGDDGGTGTASDYEIRYATFPIDAGNFNTATRFLGAPAPSAAGSHEQVVIPGLSFATTYYIAILARDEFGNPSPISNVVSAQTFEAPDIDVSPASFSAALLTGATTTRTLTLRNLSAGTLDFNLDVLFAHAPPDSSPPPDSLTAGPNPRSWEDYAREGAAADSSSAPPAAGGGAGTATLPSVISDPAGDASYPDLIELRAVSDQETVQIEMETRTDINPFNFAGFLSLDIDQNPGTGRPPSYGNGLQDIGTDYEFDFFSLGAGIVVLRHALTGAIVAVLPVEIGPRTLRFSTPLALLANDDGFIDVTGVIGDSFGPTDWFPNSGHGTITGLRWLFVEPSAGTVPPGGSVDIAVRFDASGLFGGGYDASIQIANNDPDESEVLVPAHLDVTGVTDIALSRTSLSYGSVFVGGSRLDSLVVSNPGTDLLDVTEVSSSHGDFSVSVGSFSLNPGEHRTVLVTFHPSSVGAIEGTLRIRSNDPDEGELFVALAGEGLVAPDISVTPGSLSAALLTGQTETQTLTISNTGGSDLTLQIRPRRAGPPLGLGPGVAPASPGAATSQSSGDDSPVAVRVASDPNAQVLVIQNTSAWGLDMAQFLTERFGITATVISSDQIAITDFNPYDLIITVGDENSFYYNAISTNVAKFESFVAGGGVVQYQLATQGDDVNIANGVRVRYGNAEGQNRVLIPGHPMVAGLPLLLPGNAANHCYVTQLPAGAQVITETELSHVPTTVEYSMGAGTVIATGMTWEFLYRNGYASGPILYQATAYSLSLAHPRWLSVTPSAATVPAGGSLDIAVRFDASGLFGGGYDASIQIANNDPDESEVLVPAHLDVTGVTDIALSRTSLSYGQVFVSGSRLDSLVVSNPGTDLLDVTEVSSSHGDFTVSVASFSLNPGEHRTVLVTFRPSSVGAIEGTLRIRSNDPDEGELFVALAGEGLVAPEISVTPGSLSAALLTGQSETQTLTISNTGGSDLTFQLAVRAAGDAAGISSMPGAGGRTTPDRRPVSVSTSTVQGPTLNVTAPSSGPISVAGTYSGTHLQFGITSYGELLPFQYPLGREHLALGGYVSGFTVAYIAGGFDHVRYALYDLKNGILPVSYQELVNTPSEVVVEVVTRTDDGYLEIKRHFTFRRSEKFVRIESVLKNTSGLPLTSVVFKAIADWDMDGDFYNTWDYDPERNMAYASEVRFGAIAASRAPDVMDVYGWNDYNTRTTTVDFPVGPVVGLDGMEVLHFEEGDLAPSSSARVVTAYGAADNLPELQQVMARAVQLDWLALSPQEGTVPPGSSVEIAVTFNAAGLFGGDYAASIQIESNDPTDPEVNVPAALHVTGVPIIRVEPASLSFGSVFIGLSVSREVTVFNDGTDVLSVTGIVSDGAAYHPDATAFALDPGASRVVHVTFTPTAAGYQPATLSIAHNAAGSPTLIAMAGEGLIPPDISVTPGSLSAALLTGQSETQTLTISNTGGSDLTLQINPRRAGPPLGFGPGTPTGSPGAATSRSSGDDSPVLARVASDPNASVLVIQNTSAWGLDMGQFFMERFGITATVISSTQIAATDFNPYDLIITVGDEDSFYYNAISANVAKFEAFVTGGGVVQYQLATQGTDVTIANGVQVRFGNYEYQNRVLIPGHPMVAGLPLLLPGDFANHCYLTQLPAGTQVITETEFSHVPTTVEYSMGAGTVIATGMTWEFLYLYGYPSGPILYQATAYSLSLAHPGWLSVTPSVATVPAGGSVDIAVRFDASGLNGGDYDASVQIASNDPDESEVLVPAHLHVTGAPDIALSRTSLSYGSVFVGGSLEDSLVVSNPGTDRLDVTEVSSSHGDFSASVGSFSLNPGEHRVVLVTFHPSSAGAIEGTLRLRSNDPDEGELLVSLAGEGLVPPVISVSPTSIHSNLPTDGRQVHSLFVHNGGGSDLDFTAEALTGAASVAVREAATYQKGEVDSRVGDPAAMGSGGPDRFGYRWVDSDQPGGPSFGWVEIAGIGTVVPISGDDQSSSAIPIGFPFKFYGTTFASFYVCTNGFLSFTDSLPVFTNQPLPNFGAPRNLLAAFWDDLLVGPSSRVFTHTDGARMVVEFQNVFLLGGGGPYTFEFILFRSGTVLYQYLSMSGSTTFSTVGFQNGAQDDGMTIAFNAPYLHDQLAIRISSAPSWLVVSPESGTVPAGGAAPVQATVDAAGIFPGDYAARIRFGSNDPVTPSLDVPVTLHVIGVPHLEVPLSMDFGNLFVGQTAVQTLTIRNTGTDDLDVTSITAGLADYSLSRSALSLPPLQSTEVLVTFAPITAGSKGTVITIASNDPNSPHHVMLAGSAEVPPVVGVSPLEIVAAAMPGGQKLKSLHICNTGGGQLDFTIPSPLLTVPAVAQGSYVENAKGAQDPRPGTLGIGGPDAFGHIWIDSDDPGGPAFQWIDITPTGTRVPFGPSEDDRTLGPFPIGFAFPFFDAAFDSFRICTNGWISFTSSLTSFTNQPLPNTHSGVPENLLALYWDDLVLQEAVGGSVFYEYDGSKLIVQFNNLRPFGVGAPVFHTFQALLYPNGEIKYQYLTVGVLHSSGTIGLQNAARDDGLTVAFNSSYLHDGLAVHFTRPPRWLEVSPRAGSVAPHACVDLAVRFDAADLLPGDYAAGISVMSNDPANPRVISSALFHVGSTNAADTDFNPNTLNLGSNGNHVKASVELPAGLDPSLTVLSTVLLQGQIACSQDALVLGDFNHNGIPDLNFEFSRAALDAILPEGDGVGIVVTGEIEDRTYFVARDTIRVIRPQLHHPNGGESLVSGAGFQIGWDNPSGWHVDHADLYYSGDDGASWTVIAQGLTVQSYAWSVPSVTSSAVRVRVYLYDGAGIMGYDTSDGVFRITQVTAVASEEAALPVVHALFQNSPNPFNPRTTIRFDLPIPSHVLLRVYDVQGRTVQTLIQGSLPAGRHRMAWDGRDDRGRDVASGIYYYRLRAGGFQATRRMLMLK